jgi:hypothetical protein
MGALSNEPSLLLSERRIEVEHEGISVGPQLGNDEGHMLGHQARHKGHVARAGPAWQQSPDLKWAIDHWPKK